MNSSACVPCPVSIDLDGLYLTTGWTEADITWGVTVFIVLIVSPFLYNLVVRQLVAMEGHSAAAAMVAQVGSAVANRASQGQHAIPVVNARLKVIDWFGQAVTALYAFYFMWFFMEHTWDTLLDTQRFYLVNFFVAEALTFYLLVAKMYAEYARDAPAVLWVRILLTFLQVLSFAAIGSLVTDVFTPAMEYRSSVDTVQIVCASAFWISVFLSYVAVTRCVHRSIRLFAVLAVVSFLTWVGAAVAGMCIVMKTTADVLEWTLYDSTSIAQMHTVYVVSKVVLAVLSVGRALLKTIYERKMKRLVDLIVARYYSIFALMVLLLGSLVPGFNAAEIAPRLRELHQQIDDAIDELASTLMDDTICCACCDEKQQHRPSRERAAGGAADGSEYHLMNA